jgi:Raf kinase inhibitor-like YbhB/YbcL family protein
MNTRSFAAAAMLCATALGAQAADFSVQSPTFKDGTPLPVTHVFKGFGCDGQNVSPQLSWSEPPSGTKSFAITLYDPDAPTGSGWWHWVVYNLPASTTGLPAGAGAANGHALPPGTVQGRTDYGSPGFGGACPPPGDAPHRYQLTVHALKVDKLELPADASAAMVGFMIRANRLGQASIEAPYGR